MLWGGGGLAAAALLAVLDWLTIARGWRRLGYLTKPGVMLALLVWAAAHGVALPFLLALGFSLLGDVFLMLPEERFLAGLGAFLFAHLAYVWGFLIGGWPAWGAYTLLTAAAVALVGVGFYRVLARKLVQRGQAALRVPVALYALALSLMTLSALWPWARPDWLRPTAALVGLGAVLFLASDVLLAWNRFGHPVRQARLKVRVLYHLGQILLVAGVVWQQILDSNLAL